MKNAEPHDVSFRERTHQVIQRENQLLRQARSIKLTIDAKMAELAKLEAEAAEVEAELTRTQHFLDGIGLGQRYQMELEAEKAAEKDGEKTKE